MAEARLHLVHLLVELEVELGRFESAAGRVAALRDALAPAVAPAGGAAAHVTELLLVLSVKEGVCRAYLGELPRAEQLWKPLRLDQERLLHQAQCSDGGARRP